MTPGNAQATRLPAGTTMHKLWDWHGIIGTGQSLAVGVEGTPLRATQPSFRNLKLDLGSRWLPASSESSSRLSLVPLCEPIRALTSGYPAPFPRNVYGETPHTCMASQITAAVLAEGGGGGDYVTVHSVVGESGQGIIALEKGAVPVNDTGYAYASSLFEVRAIARLAKQAQRSYGVSAIVLTHGEADAQNAGYEQALHALVRDYNTDLAVITGQTRKAELLLSQQSSCPPEPGTLAGSALAALRVSRAHPAEVVCVGPRYQYSYAPDGVHLDAMGYDRLGEKYGQVYFERLVQGRAWQPLSPIGLERHEGVVIVEFHVPVPPLVWDDSLPLPHANHTPEHPWERGRGFELVADGAPAVIDAVEIVGARVNIRSRTATAAKLLVRYAATASAGLRPQGTWRWGQLRDSDPFVGATTRTTQPNHAVTFELASP